MMRNLPAGYGQRTGNGQLLDRAAATPSRNDGPCIAGELADKTMSVCSRISQYTWCGQLFVTDILASPCWFELMILRGPKMLLSRSALSVQQAGIQAPTIFSRIMAIPDGARCSGLGAQCGCRVGRGRFQRLAWRGAIPSVFWGHRGLGSDCSGSAPVACIVSPSPIATGRPGDQGRPLRPRRFELRPVPAALSCRPFGTYAWGDGGTVARRAGCGPGCRPP